MADLKEFELSAKDCMHISGGCTIDARCKSFHETMEEISRQRKKEADAEEAEMNARMAEIDAEVAKNRRNDHNEGTRKELEKLFGH